MLLSQDYTEHKFWPPLPFDSFFPSTESKELFKVSNEVLSA